MLGNVGPLEIIVVLIIALVVFGPKRLPELGNSLGRGIREFKETVTGDHDDAKDDDAKVLSSTQAQAPVAPAPVAPAPVEAPAAVDVPVATAPLEPADADAEAAPDKNS